MESPNDKGALTNDQRFHLLLHIVDRVTSVVMLIVKGAIVLGMSASVVLITGALAGKETNANLNLSVDAGTKIYVEFFSKLDSSKYAWLIAVIGILYGLFERELRRRKTAYLQNRITKLEKMIDPNRESSGLTARGETNREDKL